MKNPFNVDELPVEEMETLGIIDPDGTYDISQEDVEALLAGRRTGLIRLNELQAGGFRIEHLDAKLSLSREPDGKATIKLHPIYKNPVKPELLKDDEAQALISGKQTVIQKIKAGQSKYGIVFEYDEDTRDFISYDPAHVLAPDKINGYKLTESQKEDFKKGFKVELPDGTELEHSATDPKGVRSDRAALIFSVLIDGGISYLLIRGIRHLLNSDKTQRDGQTPAFQKAQAEMEKHQAKKSQGTNQSDEENRGYSKTRAR
jgi:hypothetical protein